MDDFSLSLDSLEHGWAELTLRGGGQSEARMVSHVGGDSLAGIVDTALALSRGRGSAIRLLLEPEIVPYGISAQEGGTFLLTVGDSSFRGSARRYVRQVLAMFARYVSAHGEAEYAARWYHPYPSEKLEALRVALKSMNAAGEMTGSTIVKGALE